MNKLIFLSSVSLFSSSHSREKVPIDTAARTSGNHVIQSYVVDRDTLHSTEGVNKFGVTDFSIFVSRKAPDSVGIMTPKTRVPYNQSI